MANNNQRNLKAISLFSGMGGDTLGMENAGVSVVAFSEIIKTIRDTHFENFKNSELIGSDVNSDITKITDQDVKIVKGILNRIPRKILGYATPIEVFSGKKVIFKNIEIERC